MIPNNPTECAVYAIECADGRVYVGGSVGVSARLRLHRSNLNRGKHNNRLLQAAWSEMGEDAFTFSVLGVVTPDNLLSAEQRHMDAISQSRAMFNLSPTAGSLSGLKFSEESRARVSAANKRRVVTSATKAKLSACKSGERHPSAKLRRDDIPVIRSLWADGVPQPVIAAMYGVGSTAISAAVTRRTWSFVQ